MGKGKATIRDVNGQIVEGEIISAQEKESVFQKSVPILPIPLAYLIAFLNMVPGLGTILGAIIHIFTGKSSYDSKLKGVIVGLITGILQALLAVVVVGWFWSLMHGAYFVRKANAQEHPEECGQSVV